MYYDTVQFVMDVEDRFGIVLLDVDAERICTMGNLCDYLARRARLFLNAPCATSSAFYKIRRSLVENGVAVSAIRPTTTVSSVVTPNKRRDTWREIGGRFGTSLPPLRWPWRIRIAFCLFLVASLSLIPAAFAIAPGNLPLLIAASVLASIMLILGFAYANRFACVVPSSVATIGTMSQWMVARCYLQTDTPDDGIDEWVWNEISGILSLNMGVDPTSLTRETSFVNELFIDDL